MRKIITIKIISNLIPATGLKKVGTGACLPRCSISSSFQKSFKMSGHRGYEFLEFWCWNLVPFLPDVGFQLLKSSWSSLTYFSLMMRQMFSIGERSGLQAGQFSTRTLLLRCWNTRCLEGSICCSKTFIYLSAFIVPSKTCKLPIPYALMHPHTIRDAGFWTERW